MTGALEGIRVLDLAQFTPGPMCAMVLGDLGAEVIKVERPGGNNDRESPPLVKGASLYYAINNRNKHSITLNINTAEGQGILRDLVKTADVLIEGFRPGYLDGLGLGYDDLVAVRPDLIMLSVTGFGQTGPYRERGGFDMIAQAMGGLMSLNGDPDGPPMKFGTSPAAVVAGLNSAIGVLAALAHRHRTGQGQRIDVALMDSAIAQQESDIAFYSSTGETMPRVGNRRLYSAPSNAFKASDGYVYIAPGTESIWARLCRVMDRADLLEDPRFATNTDRIAHVDATEEAVQQWVGTRTVAEVVEALVGAKVPCGPVNDIPALFDDPQVAERNMLAAVEHPVLGEISMAGQPIKLSDTPTRSGGALAEPGQHNDEIYARLGLDDAGIARLRADEVI